MSSSPTAALPDEPRGSKEPETNGENGEVESSGDLNSPMVCDKVEPNLEAKEDSTSELKEVTSQTNNDTIESETDPITASEDTNQNGEAESTMDTAPQPEADAPEGTGAENGVPEEDPSPADDVDSGPEESPDRVEPPPFDTQKSELYSHLSKPLHSGQKWYLVHIRWFKQWKRFVGYDNWDKSQAGEEVARPGPIDNSSLLDSGKLRRHQVDEIDYKLVPEEAWKKLASWYGLSPDSVAISRRVVEYGKFVKQCKVEIYPLELKACLYPKENEFQIVRISRCDTIRILERKIRKVFSIASGKEVRVYNRYMTYTYELIKDLNQEAQDVGLFDGQCVLLEVQNQDASWPRTTQAARNMQMSSAYPASSSSGMTTRSQSTFSTSSNYSSSYGYSTSYGYYSGRQPTTPGLCGLSNLGNTCFMNSGLQCLVHIPSLIEYFKNDTYVKEINTKNPLGMKGELAKSFGELVKAIWSGDYAYLAPRDYKLTVGKFAPTFSGYAQQDSQEHISFLLDGLHEDLNRVVNKPYVEMKEINKPDTEAAQESWDRHQMRNKSIIVDTFQGQYKSTLVCPECEKVSITFDPFMYLSLPLPIKKTRNIKLTLIRLNPAMKPIIYKVKIPKNSRIKELCDELSNLSGIDTDRLVVCDVYSHRFHKIFEHAESINGITERDDIFVYETPINSINDPDLMCLPMYNRELRRTQYTSIATHTYVHHYLFGMPLVLPLPRDKATYKDMYKVCVFFMSRYISVSEEYRAQLAEKEDNKPKIGDVEMANVDSGNDSDDQGKSAETEQRDSEGEETARQQTISSDHLESSQTDEGDIEDTVVRVKQEPEDEIAGNMEVGGASPLVHPYSYVPDSFDISQYPPDMFRLKLVNAYGSAEMGELRDDGNCLRLSNRSVIAMEWNSKYRNFYDESVLRDIDEHESVHRKDIKKDIHLTDCIRLFTEKEILSKDDPWYCPQCQDFRQASKQLEIWRIPECLVIHLKRFSYNQYWRDKLDSYIYFPLEMDMSEHTLSKAQGSLQYELYGVSNHFGGLGGGHYTAYAKHKDNAKWYYFDDSSVTSHSQQESVVTKAGYLLFYVKKTCIPLLPIVVDKPKAQESKDTDSNDDEADPDSDEEKSEI